MYRFNANMSIYTYEHMKWWNTTREEIREKEKKFEKERIFIKE
jgi:hypothetical protein